MTAANNNALFTLLIISYTVLFTALPYYSLQIKTEVVCNSHICVWLLFFWIL